MSEVLKADEQQNLDQSYEYSVINATFDLPSENNSTYYLKGDSSSKTVTPGAVNNAFNNDYVQVVKKENEHSYSAVDKSSSASSNPPVSRIISGTLNSSPTMKSDFDKLPPQIEISLYGSETLPENSVLESDTITRDDGDKNPLTTLEVKDRRSKIKTRYTLFPPPSPRTITLKSFLKTNQIEIQRWNST